LLVQAHEIGGRAVSFLLDEADIILLLEFKHFIFAGPQILFHRDKLLGNRGRDVMPLVITHPFLEIEILLHERVEIGLRVFGGAANRLEVENRRTRLLRDRDLDRHRLHFRVGRADERFRTASHFRALHELNLGAVEIHVVFAVDRVLADVQLTGEHHLARGKK